MKNLQNEVSKSFDGWISQAYPFKGYLLYRKKYTAKKKFVMLLTAAIITCIIGHQISG
ncbi:hypothetical protein P9D77_08940 [Bacillus rugosus]|uniref:hypothetical protein n=1 Tax=Bacillus rugosus TaxID=2715209 RepID=UPI002DB94841|nr:hypothetical protein [Bacillus rugosus]MEC1548444.1 hypothetical protein [Bacillus rugosus]